MSDQLLPHHQRLIEASRISPEVAAARGYRSVETQAELKRLGFADYQCRVPALLIPIRDVRGEIVTYQIRPDEPRIDRKNGKAIKYETVKGSRMAVDTPPGARPWIGDPDRPLFLTEGARKADAAVSRGLCCLGFLGVWNWRGSNESGGRVVLPDFEYIGLKDRKVYVVFDSDVMEKVGVHAALVRLKDLLEGRGAVVFVIYLPSAEGGLKVGLDDYLATGKGVDDLLALASPAIRTPQSVSPSDPGMPYAETPGGLVWRKTIRAHEDGDTVDVRLTNFTAKIAADTCRDDGLETQHTFPIQARRADREYAIEVPATLFHSMNWPTEKLGASAIVLPGMGIKDHARAAIQLLSGEVPERRVYVHSGWRHIDDQWVYLHGGGAIGTLGTFPEIEVDLEGSLEGLLLPPPPSPEELREAVRASLNLRLIGKRSVVDPVLCHTYRSVLASIMPLDYSVALTGPTGVFKTELAGLAQGHFGAGFNGRTLPGSWKSTANSLERLLFIAKDVLVTVDDFAPGGNANEVSRYHREADNLLRGVGNRSGRGRLRPDGTARPVYRPRGATLTTGEDIPRGHSLRARLLIAEMSQGDIDVGLLTRAQQLRDAGVYATAMSGYVQWLASRLDALRPELLGLCVSLRERAVYDGLTHRRVSDITASLLCGLHVFLRFARESSAITEAEEQVFKTDIGASLALAAGRQSDFHSAEEPTARFLQLVVGVLTSGRGHLASGTTGQEPTPPEQYGWQAYHSGKGDETGLQWRPLGSLIGWVDEESILLEPEAAFAAIQELARDQGTSLPVGQRTLWKRLAEKGLLASTDAKRSRNVVRWTIQGERREVLHLSSAQLWPLSPPPNVPNGPNVPDAHDPAGMGRFSVGRNQADIEETSQENVPLPAAKPTPGPIGPIGTFPGAGSPGEEEYERGVL